MRRLFLVLGLMAFVTLPAAAQWLEEDAASKVYIMLRKTADNSAETAATITGITVSFTKKDATTSTDITCAASGTDNDCGHVSKGLYWVEVSAANTDTPGEFEVCWAYTGTYPLCRGYVILDPAAYAAIPIGGLADTGTIITAIEVIEALLGVPESATFGEDLTVIRSDIAAVMAREQIYTSTAQGGTANTITLDAAASAVTNFYVPGRVLIISGTGARQARPITAYNSTTKVATVTPAWRTTPDNTSVFVVIP